jgi:hypothetical protein
MARGMALGAIFALTLAATVGCGSSTAPDSTRLITRPIQVDSVEVLLQEGRPAAHVRGVIGDGCTELSAITLERAGTLVTITIVSTRPEEAICTQIAKLYDDVLRLPGDFPAGRYVLRVNTAETTFAVP